MPAQDEGTSHLKEDPPESTGVHARRQGIGYSHINVHRVGVILTNETEGCGRCGA